MRGMEELLKSVGIFAALSETEREEIMEIRLRAERAACARLIDGREITGKAFNANEVRALALQLMNGSFYAYEEELRQGYFTLLNGCRVGVCGRIAIDGHGRKTLTAVGSLCIRIAREIIGCAAEIAREVNGENLLSTLILAPPGMGKTTMIRDLARTLSNAGRNIAIADERGEISACVEGVPRLDVGARTDVMDNCPKSEAIPMLIRSCAPEMMIVDEIGTHADAMAILDAARCGVAVAATAHAGSFEDVKRRSAIEELMKSNIFQRIYQLGGTPGRIVWKYP